MSRADNANSGESAATVTLATGASGETAVSPAEDLHRLGQRLLPPT